MLTTKKGARAVHILSLVCTAFFLVTGCADPGPKALLQGKRLIEEGKYTDAITRLQEATELLPQNAQTWNHLGLAYHYGGQTGKAIENYQRALQVNRNLAAARYNLGHIYFNQGHYANAAGEFTIYVSFEPKNGEAWVRLATSQLRCALQLTGAEKAKWLDAARQNYEAALQFGQDPQIYNALGVIEVHRGKARDSVRLFNLALQKQANYAPPILNLAVVHHGYLNDRRTALQRYREYLAYQPRSGNLREIESAARQIESELNPPQTQQRQAYVTNSVTQVLAPAPVLNPLASRPPAQIQTNRETKSQNTFTGRTPPPKEAAPPAKTLPPIVVALPPPEVSPVPEEQPVKVAQDQPAVTSPAPTVEPSSTQTQARTGETQAAQVQREGREKQGIMKRLNPKTWFGDKTNAAPPKSQAIAPNTLPKQVTTLPAKVEYQRYRYLSPKPPRPGNRAEAVRAFNAALEGQRQGDSAKALELYRSASKFDPSFFESHYNLGLLALERSSLGEALAAYETALAILPDSANARYNLAFALQKANYPADAATEFEKLAVRNPREVRAHLSLGNLYSQQLGRPDRAKAHYQKVLDLEPQHPQATAIRYWLRNNP